jgi:DNA-directed RNA polymerase subunit H
LGKKTEEKKPAFDILAHSYNPKFEIIEPENIEKVLEGFGITRFQLPKILQTDPVVKILEAKLNDVIKITRKSHTAGESIFYRVVVVHE